MKLNQELIKRLSNGEIQLKNTGTVGQLNEILQAAFPETYLCKSQYKYYSASETKGFWQCAFGEFKNLPIFTTEQFYEHLPDVGKVINETRELAKELFVAFMYAGNLPAHTSMNKAIETAKEFIKMLDEAE